MHLTRLTWLAAAAGAALALGCGEGRVIFNVDVLSFLNSSQDTVHYPSPIPPTDTVEIPGIEFRLPPGLGGKASVDTVALTVGTTVENSVGSGKVKFQIFFGSDPATLYNTTPYAQDAAVVTGAQSAALAPTPIPFVGDTLFTQDRLYFGVRVVVQPGMVGRLRLTTMRLRIVLQDHLF